MNKDARSPPGDGFFQVVGYHQHPIIVGDVHGFGALPVHKADLVSAHNAVIKARLGIVYGYGVRSNDLCPKSPLGRRSNSGTKPELADGENARRCLAVAFHLGGSLHLGFGVLSQSPGQTRPPQLHGSRELGVLYPLIVVSVIASKPGFGTLPVGGDHDNQLLAFAGNRAFGKAWKGQKEDQKKLAQDVRHNLRE